MTDAGAGTDVHSAQRRLVLLTTGTRHAAGILDALDRRGLRADAILLERPVGRALVQRLRTALARRGLRSTLGSLRRRATDPWTRADFYAERTPSLIRLPSLVDDGAVEALRAARPDLVVLGGAPGLPAALLEVPPLGVLNAHPGLLPRYRGMDVVGRAVLNGDPVGATVHFVEPGIDTGAIVSRVEVAPLRGESLAELQARVEAAAGEALADAAATLLAEGRIDAEPQTERHPMSRRLTAAERGAAEARLR